MLPRLRQRLLILATFVVGACILWWLAGPLRPADGASGISLLTARIGPAAAVGLLVVAMLPVVALGVLTSAVGNPLSGIFAVAAALCVLAARGGSISGWLCRDNAHLPGDYGWLILEMALWLAAFIFMLYVIERLRSPLRSRWPALARHDHLGMDTALRFPQTQALTSGAVCAVIGGVLAYVLLRHSSTSQVMASLILAFAVGALVAHLVFPHSNPVGMLISPGIVALVGYAYALFSFATTPQTLSAWYTGNMPGLALALPIHYASAGIVGVTLGIGWAQTILATAPGNAPADQPASATDQ